MNRQVVKLFTAQLSPKFVEAVNGQEALDRLRDEAFDLVLLDVHMPVMDGKEAIKRIRGSQRSVAQAAGDRADGRRDERRPRALSGAGHDGLCLEAAGPARADVQDRSRDGRAPADRGALRLKPYGFSTTRPTIVPSRSWLSVCSAWSSGRVSTGIGAILPARTSSIISRVSPSGPV